MPQSARDAIDLLQSTEILLRSWFKCVCVGVKLQWLCNVQLSILAYYGGTSVWATHWKGEVT